MRDSLGKTGTPALCEAACIPVRWCLSGSDRSSGTRREAAVVARPTKIGGAGSFRHGCPASPSLCAAEAGRQPCLARPATRMCDGSHRPLGPARPRSAPPGVRSSEPRPLRPDARGLRLSSGAHGSSQRAGRALTCRASEGRVPGREASSSASGSAPRRGTRPRPGAAAANAGLARAARPDAGILINLLPIRLLASCCGFQSLGAGSHRG